MNLELFCAACGEALDFGLERKSSHWGIILIAEPCHHCINEVIDKVEEKSHDEGYENGFSEGHKAGRAEARAEAEQTEVKGYSEEELEEAVIGALEEGKADGYSAGLAEGRELERQGK